MKRLLAFALSVLLVMSGFAMAETYTATEQGFGGEVSVALTIEDGKLVDVSITGDNETEGVGKVAVEKLAEAMKESGTIDVDALTGATISSTAILKAAAAALQESGISLTTEEAQEEATTAEDTSADVVVVGAGAAGMTAAVRAAELGLKVILLEKMPMVGGNTAMSTTAVFAVNTKVQQEAGSTATVEDFYNWLMPQYATMDPDATMVLAENSGEAVDWLIGLGADFTRVFNTFYHSPVDGSAPGPQIIKALTNGIDINNVDLRLENKAEELIMKDGAVAGIKVSSPAGEYTIDTTEVILCAGGFANNAEMVYQYDTRWEGLGCSSSAGQNGDGILMAEAVGAAVVDMEDIRVNPTVLYQGDKLISQSMLRHNGGIMVNLDGKRFVNEQGSYTVASAAVVEQPEKRTFVVFDSGMLDIALVNTYFEQGMYTAADSIPELAEKLGINPEGLQETIEQYKGYVAEQTDPDFGRTNFAIDFEKTPFLGIEIKPAVQGTFGGVKVDTGSRVIDTEGNVIPGLYAAGENAGEGTHGIAALCECLVFGKNAAFSAAEHING